jgi:heme-degrading monooxygenase HmoA
VIKVINGYKLKRGADIQPFLLRLREHAMSYPGYRGVENLVSLKDPSIMAIITSWDNDNCWYAWRDSKMRAAIMKDAEPLLEEEMRVSVYRVVPTGSWVG